MVELPALATLLVIIGLLIGELAKFLKKRSRDIGIRLTAKWAYPNTDSAENHVNFLGQIIYILSIVVYILASITMYFHLRG